MKPHCNPYQVVRDFERAVAEYTGAPYCVAVNSCTAALLLAVAWHLRFRRETQRLRRTDKSHPTSHLDQVDTYESTRMRPEIEIPKRTYVSVPMAIVHAGGRPTFRDEDWRGWYDLRPLNVIDSARRFTKGVFNHPAINHLAVRMVCVSFHWSKILGIQQGGAILHADPEADEWLRRARFDGRTEGVAPKDDSFTMIGWHCYMSPEIAAEGLVRLHFLPDDNPDLPNDDYPDLSQMEIFR